MLSPAFSPPSPFHSLETSVNGKRSKREGEGERERERENWRNRRRYGRNQMKRTRNGGYNGAVSCADTMRETGLFANVDENPRTKGLLCFCDWRGEWSSASGFIVDRSSPPGIGPVVDGTRVRLVIGDLWRPRWRWMLFGHAWFLCVCVCVGV